MLVNISSADATSGVELIAGIAGKSIVIDTMVISAEVTTDITISQGGTVLFEGHTGANAGMFALPITPHEWAQLRGAMGNSITFETGDAGAITIHAGYHLEDADGTETPGDGVALTSNVNEDIIELTWITSPHLDDLPEIWVKKDAGDFVWAAKLAQDTDQLNYDTADTNNPYSGDGDYSFKLRFIRGGIAGAFGATEGPITIPEV